MRFRAALPIVLVLASLPLATRGDELPKATATAFEWNGAIRNGGPAPVIAVQSIIDCSKE